jgi:hypothetical protein
MIFLKLIELGNKPQINIPYLKMKAKQGNNIRIFFFYIFRIFPQSFQKYFKYLVRPQLTKRELNNEFWNAAIITVLITQRGNGRKGATEWKRDWISIHLAQSLSKVFVKSTSIPNDMYRAAAWRHWLVSAPAELISKCPFCASLL